MVDPHPDVERPKRLLLATLGSRGDVEPFLWLARAARDAGHEVRVALPEAPDVDTTGLDTVSLGISFADLADSLDGGLAAARAFRERIRPAMARALAAAADVAVDWRPQAIVAHPKVLTAPVAAARLGVPWFVAELTPTVTPTAEFPAAGVAARSLGPWLNRLTFRAVGLAGAMFAGDVRAARRRLGVAGVLPAPAATLAAFSPTLVPRPADWPATTRLTGDWHAPLTPTPTSPPTTSPPVPAPAPAPTSPPAHGVSPRVAEFLADPRPFLYAGFGSMTAGDASARAGAILGGARAAGLRALLVTGWGGLRPSASAGDRGDALAVDAVPLAAVLPHAAAALHHGGAGTVHAAVRAGVPSIVAPFFGDQPFWAAQLQRVGLAGPPLDPHRLTADAVAAAIATARTFAEPTRRAAERLRAEDGTRTALAEIIAAL